MIFVEVKAMVMKRCKSGQHQWDHISQVEQLQKCCNGYVRVMVGIPDENKPWREDGTAFRGALLIPECETERIKRLRALEDGAMQKGKNGCLICN